MIVNINIDHIDHMLWLITNELTHILNVVLTRKRKLPTKYNLKVIEYVGFSINKQHKQKVTDISLQKDF